MDLTKNSKYLHVLVMFILALGIPLLPAPGQITLYGMKAMGIFISVLYGWIVFDLFWSSIFGFAMLGLSGLMLPLAAVTTGIGDPMLVTTMLALAFAIAVSKIGVAELMGNWLLKQKLFHKSPWLLIAGIIYSGWLIGSIGPGMAGIVLLWVITLNIADVCKINRKDPLVNFVMVMIVLATMAGSNIMPFRAHVLIFKAYLNQIINIGIPDSGYIICVTVFSFLVVLLMILIARFILRLDASKFVLPNEILEKLESTTATKKQKIGFVITIIYSLLLILPSFFVFPGSTILASWGVPGMSLFALLLLALVKDEGKGIIRIHDVFRDLDWNLIMLLAVTFPIATCMRSEESGIMGTIMQYVAPLVSTLGLTAFFVISILILGILTQVVHNVVLGAVFMPFLLPFATELGGNIYTLWLMMFLILNTAYCTPGGSLQAAMIYGNESIERKYAYLYTTIFLVVSLLVLYFVVMPMGNVLFAI